MATKLPDADEVGNALTALLRRAVRARVLKTVAPGVLRVAGFYRDGNDAEVGSVSADLSLAAYAGACFSLIPPGMAEESIDAKSLDESIAENFAEVLNVASRLLTTTDGGRVTLRGSVFPPEALPAKATSGGAAVHFEVSIDGYGSGVLSLRAAA
jgi:hypothetical protein